MHLDSAHASLDHSDAQWSAATVSNDVIVGALLFLSSLVANTGPRADPSGPARIYDGRPLARATSASSCAHLRARRLGSFVFSVIAEWHRRCKPRR